MMTSPKKNARLSRQLRRWARASKQCYRNAFRITLRLQDEGKAPIYVEGFAVRGASCLEHGWVEMHGEIIDVTLPEDEYLYFRGLEFPILSEAVLIPMNGALSALPLFARFGWGGERSLDFTRARLQAAIHAGWTGAYVEKLRLAVGRLSAPDADALGAEGSAD
jgi:hypothetical protein